MAKAIADPEEIRRFAHDLKRFNDDLTHQLQLMRSRMSSLSQSWRDQEQRKFEEEFDFTVKAMDRFAKSSRWGVRWVNSIGGLAGINERPR